MLLMIILIYSYLLLGLLFLFLGYVPQQYIGILVFFVLKMFFNYRKCTLSYFECKLRNVKKEHGYLNNFLDKIVNARNTEHIIVIYIISIIIITFKYNEKIYNNL